MTYTVIKVRKIKVPRTPRPKIKHQVRVNKSSGRTFENFIFKFLTEYLRDRAIVGLVYKNPEGKNIDQQIDICLDSKDYGYVGIEAKSITVTDKTRNKIYLKKLNRKNAKFGTQFEKEFIFLQSSGRMGVVAFEFKIDGNIIRVFTPFQFVYDAIMKKTIYLLIDDFIYFIVLF